jgi:hypothetical protein
LNCTACSRAFHTNQIFQIYEKVANGEDLDEGKLSLPVIHMFSQSPKRQLLEAIFTERLRQGTMPMEHKRLLWDEMASVGSASIVGESWKTSEPKSLPD